MCRIGGSHWISERWCWCSCSCSAHCAPLKWSSWGPVGCFSWPYSRCSLARPPGGPPLHGSTVEVLLLRQILPRPAGQVLLPDLRGTEGQSLSNSSTGNSGDWLSEPSWLVLQESCCSVTQGRYWLAPCCWSRGACSPSRRPQSLELDAPAGCGYAPSDRSAESASHLRSEGHKELLSPIT